MEENDKTGSNAHIMELDDKTGSNAHIMELNDNMFQVVVENASIVYSKQQKIIISFIIIAQFFCGSCLSIPAPFLPKLNESHNIGSTLTGVILSVVPLFMLILCTPLGKLMSGKISGRTVLVAGVALLGLSNVSFGLLQYFPSPTDGGVDILYLAAALSLRAAQGTSSAAVTTAAATILSASFKENATTVIIYGETALALGVMCGPAVGSGFYTIGGFMLTFGGVGGILCVIFIIMCFIFPHVDSSDDEDDTAATYKQILTNVDIVSSMIFTTVTGMLWCSLEPILEPELRTKFELSQEVSALCFLLLSVPYAVGTTVVGKAFERWKNTDSLSVLLLGFAIAVPSFLIIGPTPLIPGLPRPLWVMLVSLGALGVGFGFLVVPCLNLLLYDSGLSGDATKAVILGLWNSAFSFGDFTGPIVSGTVKENVSFGWATTCGAIVALLAGLTVIGLKIHRHRTRRQQPMLVTNERTPLLSSDS